MRLTRRAISRFGLAVLLAAVGLFGYACYAEEEVRKGFRGPATADLGPVAVDLLEGRTRFESRDRRKGIASLDTGPEGERRSTLARVGAGVGLLGLLLVLAGRWAGRPAETPPPKGRR